MKNRQIANYQQQSGKVQFLRQLIHPPKGGSNYKVISYASYVFTTRSVSLRATGGDRSKSSFATGERGRKIV